MVKAKGARIGVWVGGVLALICLLGYGAVCAWLYQGQEGMLFWARPIAPELELGFTLPHEEVFLDAPDGARLHGVLFHANAPTAVVLHFHGNAENILDMEGPATRFVELGYSFLAVDYRTYGKSRGDLSEANLFADAALFFACLEERGWAQSDIVISGRSIGTGIATELASRTKPRALVLYSPFLSMLQLASERFPYVPFQSLIRYPLNSAHYLKSVGCPVLMFHGDRDPVFPLHHARGLAAIKGELLVFNGGDHDNLTGYDGFWEGLVRVVDGE